MYLGASLTVEVLKLYLIMFHIFSYKQGKSIKVIFPLCFIFIVVLELFINRFNWNNAIGTSLAAVLLISIISYTVYPKRKIIDVIFILYGYAHD